MLKRRTIIPLNSGAKCITGLLVFLIISSPGLCDQILNVKWSSGPDLFRMEIAAGDPIRFLIADHTEKKGYFSVDILNITQPYEDRDIELDNPQVRKIIVRSLPDNHRIQFLFFPKPGTFWKVSPGSDLRILRIMISQKHPIPEHSEPLIDPHTLRKIQEPAGEFRNAASYSSAYEELLASEGNITPYKTDNAGSQGVPVSRSRKLVIIDPGHGGVSKGARTSRKIKGRHYWEKDLVIKYARKLKYLIDQDPDIDAIVTRKHDEYVSLGERVKFAHEHGGDLFISIHLNASPRPSTTARGIEFYYWRETGSDNAAVSYLEKLENDRLLPDLPESEDENLKEILTNMLKDALDEEKCLSAQACSAMWEVFKENPYFKRYHRSPTVKSARFVVLANYAMPAILIEVGFLSNYREAPYLISESFQWTASRLIYNGIQKYFSEQDPNFKPRYVKY